MTEIFSVRNFRTCLEAGTDAVCCILIVLIAALACFQVAARYLLYLPAPWAEELLRLLFVWLVMAGASRGMHLRLDIVNPQTDTGRRVFVAARNIAGIFILCLLSYGTFVMIKLTEFDRFTSLSLSVKWSYVGVAAGIAVWVLREVADLYDAITKPDGSED